MEQKDKIEQLKFCIGRFDTFYENVNSKGNLYLPLNSFLMSGIIGGYFSLKDKIHFDSFTIFLLGVTLLFNLLGFGFTIWATMPYLKSTKKTDTSLIFFNDVASNTWLEFEKKYDAMTAPDVYLDFKKQGYLLASGLKKKFLCLTVATIFLILQFVGIIISSIIIFNK